VGCCTTSEACRISVTKYVEPVTEEQALLVRHAYADFGKGRHPAGLNFGDCFSSALAIASGEPLLFKGNDFSKTDVKVVRQAG
jgi:ribonuclease VapC